MSFRAAHPARSPRLGRLQSSRSGWIRPAASRAACPGRGPAVLPERARLVDRSGPGGPVPDRITARETAMGGLGQRNPGGLTDRIRSPAADDPGTAAGRSAGIRMLDTAENTLDEPRRLSRRQSATATRVQWVDPTALRERAL